MIPLKSYELFICDANVTGKLVFFLATLYLGDIRPHLETFLGITMEGSYWQLVGRSPAAAQHPTTPSTPPRSGTGKTQPQAPEADTPALGPSGGRHAYPLAISGRGSGGGYPHMKAWETEAQFKWLVQSHTKWSLLPVYVLSSLTTSSVLPDMEPPKASMEVQWGRGYRSSSAGSPGPRAGLALWAPRGWASLSQRARLPAMLSSAPPGGSRDLDMIPRAYAFCYWKELGVHPDSWGPPAETPPLRQVCLHGHQHRVCGSFSVCVLQLPGNSKGQPGLRAKASVFMPAFTSESLWSF